MPAAVILDLELELAGAVLEAQGDGLRAWLCLMALVTASWAIRYKVRGRGFVRDRRRPARLEPAIDAEARAGRARQFFQRGAQALGFETNRE